MKSSIKIDFTNGYDIQNRVHKQEIEPCIKVILSESDDPRDKLLKVFFEKLGHRSRYLVCEFVDKSDIDKGINIFPVKPEDLAFVSSELAPLPPGHAREGFEQDYMN